MFTLIRPVETLTHLKVSQVVLLQTGRFILNNLTLIALISMVWSPNSLYQRKVALTSLAVVVLISGIVSLILLISHFYNLRSKKCRRSSVTGNGMTMTSTHPNAGMALVNAGMAMATSSSLPSTAVGSLSVNSRPSSSVSPERRLDSMVLGSESITNLSQFIDPGFIESPGFKQMARPIPTFNSFGIAVQPNSHHEHDHVHLEQPEVHRAMPVFAPTPSPGSSEPDINGAPPLPARITQQNGHPNGHNLHIQQSSQQQQPHSLPFFPFHQFPGRSVKPMRKSLLLFFLNLFYNLYMIVAEFSCFYDRILFSSTKF